MKKWRLKLKDKKDGEIIQIEIITDEKEKIENIVKQNKKSKLEIIGCELLERKML